MAIRVQNQAEPIPGYRLIERIGIGGFGEVWKAEAPGGILKAIKFVHGSLQADDGQGVHAQQELKALNRVKSVRHPYILSLERYDIVDGQLLIVMELADRNLWDRFKECRSQGLIGIPRDELLRYMEEAAEALDLMTNQYQLQHLDIKPQNLFLVHNHVKVADFGLVKDLEGMKAHVTSGVTPIYAAPETFDGIVSSQCDQYSLAIVYQELLTGQRPFSGTNIRQLLMQHMTGIPDVAPLPPGDREVILKALAKKPEDRHASCTAMVQALRRGASAAGATWLPPSTTAEVTLPTTPASGHSRNTLSNPLPLAQAPSQPAESLSGIIDRRSRSMAAIKSTPADLPEMTRVGLFTDRARQPAAPPRQEVTGPGVLFPALIVGVGKLGMQVLQQVRKFLHERCGPPSLLPNIRFLQVDTDPSIVTEARQTEPEAVLQEKEVFLARLNRPVHYLKPMRGRPRLDAWIDNQMIYRIPRNHQSTEGLRALGRLALIDNYPALVRRMQTELDFITNPSALTTADKKTQLGLRTNRPRIYIVTSLGGGTGSGMFLDLAYLFRHLLKQMGYVSPDVVALLLAPTNDSTPHGSLVLTNTYAALMELNHFSAPHVTFTGHYEENEWPINDKAPPFTRIQVLSLPAESKGQAPTRRVLALAGDFLCRELITPLGKKIDAARAEADVLPPAGVACQVFGLHWISWPRRALLQRIGRRLCHRLVTNWLTIDPATAQESIRTWVTDHWSQEELTQESLVQRLQSACLHHLKQPAESAFEAALAGLEASRGFLSSGLDPAEVLKVLDYLEKLLGKPQGVAAAGGESGELVAALKAAAQTLSEEGELKITRLIARLIDDPNYRLAGAEAAIPEMMLLLEAVVERHSGRCQQLHKQAAELHTRIHSLVFNLQKGSWFSRRGRTASELLEALRLYPRARLEALISECLLTICKTLSEGLNTRTREVAFCRNRINDFARSLQDSPAPEQVRVDPRPGEHLLPEGCRTLGEAVQRLFSRVTPEQLADFDRKVQELIQKQFRSLVHVCMTSSDLFKELETAMQGLAETYAKDWLGGSDVVDIYLKRQQHQDKVLTDLAALFDEAEPELNAGMGEGPELRVLASPDGPAGERLRYLVRQALPHVDLVPAESTDEIVFYRERLGLTLADLPQANEECRAIYEQFCGIDNFTPHTRIDIPTWLPLVN